MKLVVTDGTTEVVSVNNPAGTGQIVVEVPDSECGDVANHPNHYLYVGGTLVLKSQAEIDTINEANEIERLRAIHLECIEDYVSQRMESTTAISAQRKKNVQMIRKQKLMLKKINGTISPTEEAELDAAEALSDYLDNVTDVESAQVAWLSDPARTLVELQAYDCSTTPTWP